MPARLPLGCLGRCLARRGHLLAQGVTVATAHTGDMPDQLLPGLDVVLSGDGNLFHDRRAAAVVAADIVYASGR